MFPDKSLVANLLSRLGGKTKKELHLESKPLSSIINQLITQASKINKNGHGNFPKLGL